MTPGVRQLFRGALAGLMVLLVMLAILVILAGCGSSITTTSVTSTTTSTTTASVSALTCQPGHSYMGCSVVGFRTVNPPARLGGQKVFPDVSDWQGFPNWGLAKPHISGAGAKLGEYTLDPSASYNFSQFHRLNIPSVAYWFVRPTGCAHEGGLIQHYVAAFGISRLVLDEEAPGISGYAACLNPYVRAATGQDALVYRSSGNNFDSSANGLKCWVAAYGPSSPPACNGRLVAWQYTDGKLGFPTYVPGVGLGDVSNDYGIFGVAPKPKPSPYTMYEPRRYLLAHGVRASLRNTVQTWDRRGCRNPVRRTVCKTSRYHLVLLDNRLKYLPSNATRRAEIQGINRRLIAR